MSSPLPDADTHAAESLLVRVGQDIAVLGEAATIARLRQWQAWAHGPEGPHRTRARGWLVRLGRVLASPPRPAGTPLDDLLAASLEELDQLEEASPPSAPETARIRASGPSVARHDLAWLGPRVAALAEELVRLPKERRAKRFWARWPDVSQRRFGIRRPELEALLTTTDAPEDLRNGILAQSMSVSCDEIAAALAMDAP